MTSSTPKSPEKTSGNPQNADKVVDKPADGSLPFESIFAKELEWIDDRRQQYLRELSSSTNFWPQTSETFEHSAKEAQRTLDLGLVGLSLSGGGIRSATLSLGFLQGLARLKLLGIFDYVSSVSGEGYTASWLAAWVHRERSLTQVEKQLDHNRVKQSESARRFVDSSHKIVDEEPEPINHLRSYSRYLTPRPGMFSADSWSIIAIYVRNTLINTTILLAACIILILLSRFVVRIFELPGAANPLSERGYVHYVFMSTLGMAFSIFGWMMVMRSRIASVRNCAKISCRNWS